MTSQDTDSTADSIARGFLFSSIIWLVVGVSLGAFLSLQFVYPDLSNSPYLQFGRLRPLHVAMMLYGWLSMTYMGAMFYSTPGLAKSKLYSPRLGWLALATWNLLLISASITLPLGMTQGREYAELIYPLDVLFVLGLAIIFWNLYKTVVRGEEKRIYVSLWHFLAALAYTAVIYALGNAMWSIPSGALYGINDAMLNWFYVPNYIGFWLVAAPLGMALYLLPSLTRNPLYSHGLAIIGFWSIFASQQHLIFSPIPTWIQTIAIAFAVLSTLPVLAYAWNFWKTMEGAWAAARSDIALRFLAAGSFMYILTCIQGMLQPLRTVQSYIHFTNWIVGHSHFALFGFASFVSFAFLYHAMPKLLGSELRSRLLSEVHFWFTLLGMMGMALSLWVAGYIEGSGWNAGTSFVEVLRRIMPMYSARSIAGFLALAGQYALAANVLLTIRGMDLK